TYDAADISVDATDGTWSLDYSPQATTTTTLETPTPDSPVSAGTTVTLTADVGDPSAPGTVQFQSGGTNVGSPQTVTNGVATLTTTALPVGNPDSLTAVFTPTTGAAFSGSTSNTVQYVVSAPGPGGTVTLYKSTALIGNYGDKVSGTGWTHDTSVTLNECATTTYSAATCDAANQVSNVTLGTGRAAGTFKSAVIDLAVGTIDTNGDTCGVVGSTPCYVVVVGNISGDTTASGALSFTLPSFTVKTSTNVLGNFVDAVKAAGFPIGDTVVAQECDASALVPSTVSTHCDAATQISGTSGASGKVVFTSTGVKLLVGSAYSDTAGGTCELAGSCAIGVTDSDNSAIGVSV
ncbi:MAG TPA: Ig-like domain-containing protein, partial [Acidimicrobiales bacterium]